MTAVQRVAEDAAHRDAAELESEMISECEAAMWELNEEEDEEEEEDDGTAADCEDEERPEPRQRVRSGRRSTHPTSQEDTPITEEPERRPRPRPKHESNASYVERVAQASRAQRTEPSETPAETPAEVAAWENRESWLTTVRQDNGENPAQCSLCCC